MCCILLGEIELLVPGTRRVQVSSLTMSYAGGHSEQQFQPDEKVCVGFRSQLQISSSVLVSVMS